MLGPNGAGKSTTVRILTTLSDPTAGRARVAGFDVTRDPQEVRHRIGYVAQSSGVDLTATGRENLTLQGQLFHIPASRLRGRVGELLQLFGAAYSGMGILGDIDRGVLDRMLATPVSRGAVMAGRILHSAAQVIVQASIILLVAFLLGARPHGGLIGLLVVLLAASLLGAAFASFSNALALLARRQELVIAVMNFTILPMMFTSSMIMSRNVMPQWIRGVSRYNPLNWAVTAARDGFEGQAPAEMSLCLALLAGFALVCAFLATRAFGRYRRAM